MKLTTLELFIATALLLHITNASTKVFPQDLPVIGIISTPDDDRNNPESYLKTTYAEFAEVGDARVVPIPWDIDEAKFKTLLESVNGVLFTGGGAFLWDEDEVTGKRTYSAFQKRLNYIVNFVIQKKKQGIHYPLMAICQGFEAVSIALTGDLYILDRYVHFGKLSEVYFTPEAKTSTLFQYFTQDSFDFLQNHPTLYYWHEYALNTSVPSLYPALSSDKWTVTGISKDDNGKEFIAAMESKEYPIYMVMYHAERILWEATHSAKAKHPSGTIFAIKLMADSFITEAAKNENEFENKNLLEELLIEKFPVTDLGIWGLYYLLDKNSLDEKWNAVYDDNSLYRWIVAIVLVILVVGPIVGCFQYRNKKVKELDKPYKELDDNRFIELKPKMGRQLT